MTIEKGKKTNNWYLNDNLLMRNGYLVVPTEKVIQDFINDYKEMYNEIYLLQQELSSLKQENEKLTKSRELFLDILDSKDKLVEWLKEDISRYEFQLTLNGLKYTCKERAKLQKAVNNKKDILSKLEE
jgi:hypothetical protein